MVIKTTAELEALTPEQLDAYKTELKAHEDNLVAKQISEATESVKAEMQKEIEKVTTANKELSEQIEQLKEKSEMGSTEKETDLVKAFKENAENFTSTDKAHNFATTVKAAALMTTANVTPNVAGGFSPLFGNYIDSEIGSTPKPDNVFLPLVTVKTQPGTESIWYADRVNEDGDAAFIGEGDLKPLADADYATVKKDVKEVAVRWKFTKRLMNHAPSVVLDFAQHANELVEQKIDDQVLAGDGLGDNLEGMTSVASAFIAPSELADYYDMPNIYDVINAVATQIRLANFKGQLTAVLNTVWAAKMKGIKNSEGDYIVPPFVTPDGMQVGEVRIVFSNKIANTDILLGDLKKFNVVISEGVSYDEGYENDDFSKNLVSRKLEAFLGTYLKASDVPAIVHDTIANVLTDIEKPTPTP
jgi:HK97 family phage major capsid protein